MEIDHFIIFLKINCNQEVIVQERSQSEFCPVFSSDSLVQTVDWSDLTNKPVGILLDFPSIPEYLWYSVNIICYLFYSFISRFPTSSTSFDRIIVVEYFGLQNYVGLKNCLSLITKFSKLSKDKAKWCRIVNSMVNLLRKSIQEEFKKSN